MRLFLAINFPEAVRAAVHHAVQPLRDAAPRVGWTEAERLHLTMKFLGEQPESVADDVSNAVSTAVARHRPFDVTITGLGAFPSFRRARIVWIGLSADPRLELLHHDVELACEAVGFAPEGRTFRPHVTLGRLRQPGKVDELRALSTAARAVTFVEQVMVDRVELMESRPGKGGPRYVTRAAAMMETL